MSAEDRRGRPVAQWRPRVPGNTDLGTRLVCVRLQVEHLHQLPGRGTDTVHGAIADQLASEARRLDGIQTRIVQLATRLHRDLESVIDGRGADEPTTNGILQSTAPDIDLLAARCAELRRSLTELVEVYNGLPPFTAASAATEVNSPRQRAASTRAPRRSTVETSSAALTPAKPARTRDR
ncbi:hypothetical protein ABZX85_39425 [Streptomyces sp. NPDC004539]|uniref:hypothetical protein n=1 Tax=Streptomyces sp. NPDC004539 TaxID=3154280 RepID=UPI0033AE1975